MRHTYFTCDLCGEEIKKEMQEKLLKIQDGGYIFEKNHCHICKTCMSKLFGAEYTHYTNPKKYQDDGDYSYDGLT